MIQHTKPSNASEMEGSNNLSPKALKISEAAIIEVLHKALRGFFIAFTTTNTILSLITQASHQKQNSSKPNSTHNKNFKTLTKYTHKIQSLQNG